MENPLMDKTGGGFRLPKGKLWTNRGKAPEIFYSSTREPIIVKPGESRFQQFLSDADIDTYFLSPDLWNAHRATEELFRDREHITILLDASKIDKLGDQVMMTIIPKAYKEMYEEKIDVSVLIPKGFEMVWIDNPDVQNVLTSLEESDKFDVTMNVNGLEMKWKERSGDKIFGYRNRSEVILENLGMFSFNRKPVWRVTDDESQWAKLFCKDFQRPIIGYQTKASCRTRTLQNTETIFEKIQERYSTIRLDELVDGKYRFSVRQMAALINECDVVVAPDSAVFHIAGALGKRIVGLFGHTGGEIYCEDYEKALYIQGECPYKVGPCWWTLNCIEGSSYQDKCDKENPQCLRAIYSEVVLKHIEEQLTQPKKVLACMLTYNLLDMTKKAIASIRAWNDYDIFVVDNESKDGTQEWLKDKNISHAVKRCGVAEACNIGLKKFLEGGYDYFLLLNNDITLRYDCIDRLVSFLEKNKDCYGVFATTANCAPWLIDRQKPEKDTEVIVDIPPGAYSATLFSRECVEVVGLFDERFRPRYIEDNDYTLRIRLAGKRFCRTGMALFYHALGGVVNTNEEEKRSKDIHWVTNLKLYQDKWGIHPHESQALGKINKNIVDTSTAIYRMTEMGGKFHLAVRRWMGGLGDHIFMSVIAEYVKKKFPLCKITYVVPKQFKDAYAYNQYIDFVRTEDWGNLQADLKIDCTDIDYKFEMIEMQKFGKIQTPRDQIYLNHIGIYGEELHPKIVVEDSGKEWARNTWQVAPGIKRIAVAKESSNMLKNWPYMAQLINEMGQWKGCSVLQLDTHTGWGYQYSFPEAMKLISISDVVVSLDSAFSNAGGALGIPTVAIFGYRDGRVFQKMFPSMNIVQMECPLDKKSIGCDYNVKCHEGESHRDKENRGPASCLRNLALMTVVYEIKRVLG